MKLYLNNSKRAQYKKDPCILPSTLVLWFYRKYFYTRMTMNTWYHHTILRYLLTVGTTFNKYVHTIKYYKKEIPCGKWMSNGIFNMYNIESTRMSVSVLDDSNSPQVVTSSNHAQVSWNSLYTLVEQKYHIHHRPLCPRSAFIFGMLLQFPKSY
jgi:hypothetical protein